MIVNMPQDNHELFIVRRYMRDYAACYEINYQQKKELGLFKTDFQDQIEIELGGGNIIVHTKD